MDRVERGSRHWIDRLTPIRRWSNRFEALQVRWLGTNGIAFLLRVPVLAIETVGRKSGRRRRTAVAYLTEYDCFLIGGGAAGQARLPDWVANLRANPSAIIWVRRRRIDVVAEELRGEARDQAYGRNLVRYPRIAKYEQMSGREIPYFRLVPPHGLVKT